jgi:hypothetical protein
MKLARCPICHATIHLDALIQDESGRALLGLLAANGKIARPLVAYLTLFRPAQRDLSNDRALSLAQEALSLESDVDVLRTAMIEATEAAREKQMAGLWKTPKDHGWLKAFLKNSRARQNLPAEPRKSAAVTTDVPPERARSEAEKRGGMPENLKAAFNGVMRG